MLPQNIFILMASEMPFPMFPKGKFHTDRKRATQLPLRQENSETTLSNIHILRLVLVYMEYFQRGQPLLTHSASKRGF